MVYARAINAFTPVDPLTVGGSRSTSSSMKLMSSSVVEDLCDDRWS